MAKAQQTRPVDDLVVHKNGRITVAKRIAFRSLPQITSPMRHGARNRARNLSEWQKNPIKSEASYRGNAAWIDLNLDTLNSLQEQAIRIASGARSSLPPAFTGTTLLNFFQNPGASSLVTRVPGHPAHNQRLGLPRVGSSAKSTVCRRGPPTLAVPND
jgi:hypothetical protein